MYIKNEYIKNQHTIENEVSRLLWENRPIMTKSEAVKWVMELP